MQQPVFFDPDERYVSLSKQGAPLELLNSTISSHPEIEKIIATKRTNYLERMYQKSSQFPEWIGFRSCIAEILDFSRCPYIRF
ncbi:hypothetical protein ACFL1S_04280 [Pseudomonadota bacterium]